MAESFGRLLQRYRVSAGLSQEDLAELAGVSTNAISALERGLRHAPHSVTLDLLIAALKLDNDARVEIWEAAKLARARRIQAQRLDMQPELPEDFLPNNLPSELTSFVDREKEVAEIQELLKSNRLVTLVGSGGVGKSRCALRVAGMMLAEFVDGVWLVELAPISDPLRIPAVIAQALKLQESPNHPMLDTAIAHLKRQRVLLILDNCEHVISEARHVAAMILRECPNVRILATSRESFTIAGERAYRIPSLPVPSASQLLSLEELSQYGAVRLFSDRAFSADDRFMLTNDSAPHVADICRRLDGIPLGIELAAARVRVLAPQELAKRLDERFRMLTAGDHSALPRHQTMRALIDWSYDLLSEDERRFLRKLSIFAGGFTLEAAAAVCAESKIDEIAIVELLSSLVDKSLVQVDVVESDARYSLLETTRQYAREKLKSAGEEETTAHAHAAAFFQLGEQLYDAYAQSPDRTWVACVERELENFQAALSWTFGTGGDVLLGQRIVGVLRAVWYSLHPVEGTRWLRIAQHRITAHTPAAILAVLDVTEAIFETVQGHHEVALPPALRALAHYSEIADPRGMAVAQGCVGRAKIFLGQVAEGEAALRQALDAFRAQRAVTLVALALENLAYARMFAGDVGGARKHFSEAQVVARACGANQLNANLTVNWAESEFRNGDADAALRLANDGLALLCALGETRRAADARSKIPVYLVSLRRYDEALAMAQEALSAAQDMQWSVGLAWALQHLAAIAALRPESEPLGIEDRRRAARMVGYVDARLSALEVSRTYTEQQEYDAMIPALRDALGDDELARLTIEGASWSEDQAIAEAMLV